MPADRHGRLGPSPEVLAAIEAAVASAWPRPDERRPAHPAAPVWRFSGRWWAARPPGRRARS